MSKAATDDLSSAKKRRLEALDKAFGSALQQVLEPVGTPPAKADRNSTPKRPANLKQLQTPSPGGVDMRTPMSRAHSLAQSVSMLQRGGESPCSSGIQTIDNTMHYDTLEERVVSGTLAAPLKLCDPLLATPEDYLDAMLADLMRNNPKVADPMAQIAARLQDKAGTLLLDKQVGKFNIEAAKDKGAALNAAARDTGKARAPLMGRRERRAHAIEKYGKRGIPKEQCRYELYTPLNNLWNEYIVRLLGPCRNLRNPPKVDWIARLPSADFHGSLIQVTKCKDPSRIGIKGIVVMDTSKTFHVISDANFLYQLPKAGTVFALKVGNHTIMLHGGNLMEAQAQSCPWQPAGKLGKSGGKLSQPNRNVPLSCTMEL